MRVCIVWWRPCVCSLHTTTHPSVDAVKLWPITGSSSNCRLKMHMAQCEPGVNAETHSCKLKREVMRPWMNGVLNAGVYFYVSHSIMLNTFALESSVLMLLNISLSNRAGRQNEDALWEKRQWGFEMQQTPHNGRRRREKVEHRLCEREVTKGKPKQKKKKM